MATLQGVPLADFGSTVISNTSGLGDGTYTYYFAVDLGGGQLFWDSVEVVVVEDIVIDTPLPKIYANGSEGSVTISTGEQLAIAVSLTSGSFSGDPADWYIVVNTPSGWQYYDFSLGAYTPGLMATLQGVPLVDFGSTVIFNTSGLGAGTYTYYFAVDLDGGRLYSDLVNVTVTDSDPIDSDPCSAYAGNWSGTYSETYCDGVNYSGTWTGVVTSDCSITTISDEGGSSEGTITGNNVSGSAFDPFCGTVSIVGTISGNSISGTYTYSSGGSGSFSGSKN
jgi:hypothetical protein